MLRLPYGRNQTSLFPCNEFYTKHNTFAIDNVRTLFGAMFHGAEPKPTKNAGGISLHSRNVWFAVKTTKITASVSIVEQKTKTKRKRRSDDHAQDYCNA